MSCVRDDDGVFRDLRDLALFSAPERFAEPVRPPGRVRELYHCGVLRAAGALHVGAPHVRARAYLRDAEGYAASGLSHDDALERERRDSAVGHAENMRRSYVAALSALLSWVDGDTSTGGAP